MNLKPLAIISLTIALGYLGSVSIGIAQRPEVSVHGTFDGDTTLNLIVSGNL